MKTYITKTNSKTHEVVEKNRQHLPVFEGEGGKGKEPRYCPSLESKLRKFPNVGSHTVFLEHEGLNSDVIFPTGLNTGLPLPAQIEVVRTIAGL